MNAAQDSKATASYSRVIEIHRGLSEFAECRAQLRKPVNAKKWNAALAQLEEQRRLVAAGKKGATIDFPATRKHSPDLLLRAQGLHSAVNQSLYRYIFRPRLTYFIHAELWMGGMVPDARSEWFEVPLNGFRVSEADAVLALVRLDLTGELGKVRVCEMCHRRWCVAGRSHYRFCSKGCREAWYESQPDYHERKARNARRYRQLEKRRYAMTSAMSGKRRK
ncbi:MAG: hypothetical protein ACRD4V_02835 [Candidatus Acidiferrales bacterium]